MLSPETTKTLPSGSAVAVGYQRVDAHVRPARPRALLRVVDVGVLDAEVGVLVAAEDQQPPVGAGDLAGAEQVAPGRDSSERSGARIPDPLGVESRLEAVPRGHAPVRRERQVHGDDRPLLRRCERSDRVRSRIGRGLGSAGHDRVGHVRADLGRAQSAVVDADLVDEAAEALAPDVVGAEAERAVADVTARRPPGASLRRRRSRTGAASRRRTWPRGASSDSRRAPTGR